MINKLKNSNTNYDEIKKYYYFYQALCSSFESWSPTKKCVVDLKTTFQLFTRLSSLIITFDE